jgi:site-specific DNA-methyltransferase (adenine-specific)
LRTERIGGATLYLADSLDIISELPQVDAVVTDPPYGIGFAAQPTKWQRRAGQQPESWDDQTPDIDGLRALGKKQLIWGGNHYQLPTSRGWISWYKPDAPPSMGHFELAWTNQDQNPRMITFSIGAGNAERVGHPTQKPVAVMLFSLQYIGVPELVLDPFMGSGTTGVACSYLGKRFIGVEVDPKYFEMACERIENAQRQERLFA